MSPADVTPPTLLDYPKVTLLGKEYELRFTLHSSTSLAKEGIILGAKMSNQDMLANLGKILAAGVAHTGAALDPEALEKSIDLGEVPVYLLAMVESLKKVSQEALAATASLAAIAKAVQETNGMPAPPTD